MASASAYETARAANIRRNQALLADLNLRQTAQSISPASTKPRGSRHPSNDSSSAAEGNRNKRRKLATAPMAPSRISARLAASDRPRPTYNEEAAAQTRSAASSTRSGRGAAAKAGISSRRSRAAGHRQTGDGPVSAASGVSIDDEDANGSAAAVPNADVASIVAGWSQWTPSAEPPSRDGEGTFHFEDEPTFLPNKSPAEMIREGAFGGSYWRPLRSRRLGVVVEGDWEELPKDWIEGLDVAKFLTSDEYDPDINKYKVACGQSIEEWEAAGWINHTYDVRGWFQWYARFFQGRRCEDDERQISRWRKCVGETGRWRRMLLKKYVQAGVRTVWDDGEDEDVAEVSPVIHQTCHHWAFEVRQETLDAFWEGR